MDISVHTSEHLTDDQSWKASAHGSDSAQTITLDVSTFTAETHFPDGFIPSGVTLGKITSGGQTGKYGPYDNGASDGRQTMVGHLDQAVKVTSGGADVAAPLFWHGGVRENRLPTGHGLDSAGKVEVKGQIVYF